MDKDCRLLVPRRSVLALPLIAFFPLPAGAVAPLVIVALNALVAKVVGYVVEKILDSYFGSGDTSTTALVDFIRTSIAALEQSLKADFRRAIADDKLRELVAHTESVQSNLILYSKLKAPDRQRYRTLLDQALVQTADGATLAATFGVVALPSYAVFVTQRVFVMQSLFILYPGSSILRAYADELSKSAERVLTVLAEYEKALDPATRVGDLECYVREGEGGFVVRYVGCRFKVDQVGDPSFGYEDIDPNHDRADATRARAEQVRQAKLQELQAFKADQVTGLILPLRQVVASWQQLVPIFAAREPRRRHVRRV